MPLSLSANGPVKALGICIDTRKDVSMPPGRLVSIDWTALGPPVEAPMATKAILRVAYPFL